ncbi:MAG: hypothetical protein ACLGHE_10590 [Gammaproteobacteria bacterium]
MASPHEKNLLSLRLLSMETDFDGGLLALLIQKSDESLLVSKLLFPLEIKAGRKVALNCGSITTLVEKGVVERTEEGLHILVESIVRLMSDPRRGGTNTTTNCRGSKNSSTTNFLFEKSDRHGRPLAFIQGIGARVRSGIIAQVAALDFDTAQMVVHEVGARTVSGSIKGDAVTYTRGIVAKAMRGQFVPAAGLALADELDAQLVVDVLTEREGFLRVVK